MTAAPGTKRLAWLTDLHLNFLSSAEVEDFLLNVKQNALDAVLIGGDISESQDLLRLLEQIAITLEVPVYFVLGNHDFYFGSIYNTREQVEHLCQTWRNLVYLTSSDVVELTPTLGLVGHDGWADARIGDYERSLVMMHDYRLIEELAGFGKQARLPLLHQLGDEAAAHIRRVLPMALARYPHVLLLTHIPPMREACWHEGRLSDDEWAPHFTCKAMGDALLEIMDAHPHRQLTVLCGHTHSSGETRPRKNVLILTGAAQYGAPAIQRIIEERA